MSMCTDEQNNYDQKSEKKKVKPGNVIKKLNLSEVNVSDPDLMSSLQLLFCHFVYDKIDDKTSYPWMIHRWIFLF